MEMNIKDNVYVRLTPEGEEAYRKYYKEMNLKPPSLKKTGEWTTFKMWELMNIFGSKSFNGRQAQFKENIIRFTPPN